MFETARISGHTHFICLLGNPTGHSLSPAIHNLSFGLLGVDAVYLCCNVQSDDLGGIITTFKAMESWDGCNLTMPCKQAVIPHLDRLDIAAELIGAVNLVAKDEDGCTVGYNTDGIGFMASLRKRGIEAEGARMVLLGPGGAGSAVATQAALDGVAHLDIFARAGGASYESARALTARVTTKTKCAIELHDLNNADDLAFCIQEADIMVNVTPVGMGEDQKSTPVHVGFLKQGLVVADLIYHPRETRLLREAKERGCPSVSGLGMLLEQAAAGETIWYGVDMPVDEIARQLF